MRNLTFLTTVLVFCFACTARAEEEAKPPDQKYEIAVVADPSPVSKDGQATYVLTITPKGEWVLKKETPFSATLKSNADVKLEKSTFNNKDFKDPEAAAKAISTRFKASAAGGKKIEAALSFFLCTEKICQRHKDEAELTFEVAETAK